MFCALWTVGETLSCDQCGRECVPICGTRQFRACCYNNLKKRMPDDGIKLWHHPPREPENIRVIYDA
ncbi:hypothetical protein PV325_003329 [Microctonus aethiopoides]|nr:hypothetical protein PV325_003329 [Microctonus aethiopoides]